MSSEDTPDNLQNVNETEQQLKPEDNQINSATDQLPEIVRNQTPQKEEITAEDENKDKYDKDDDDESKKVAEDKNKDSDDDESNLLSPIITVILPDVLPKGCQPLFISSSTQKIFQVQINNK